VSGLIVGVGHPDRRDDGVGPLVAARVATSPPTGVDVRTVLTPLHLPDVWEGYGVVVVVDAVVSGGPLGEVSVTDIVAAASPGNRGAAGTHGFGLRQVVELARVTGRLPRRLVLVGIEAADFSHGDELSPAVSAALPEAELATRHAIG